MWRLYPPCLGTSQSIVTMLSTQHKLQWLETVLSFLPLSSCKCKTFRPEDEQTVSNQPGRVRAGWGRLNRKPVLGPQAPRGPRDRPGTEELQNPPWIHPWVAPSMYRILRRWPCWHTSRQGTWQYIAMSSSLESREFWIASSALHVSVQGVPEIEGTRRSCVFWSRAK